MRKLNGSIAINESRLVKTCVLNRALSRISRRWKMQILFFVHHGSDGFTTLKTLLPGISDQTLGVRLNELLSEGLLSKCQSDNRPIYQCTPRGSSLLEIMQGLCDWEKQNG